MATRLFDAPHGQLHEFEKRLQAAGLTAEHVKMLLADDTRLRAWVAKVDESVEPEPPHTRVPIEAAFGGKGGIMYRLLRMKFVYLDEVAELTKRECLNIPGFGPTSLGKLYSVLSQHGLKFSETYSEPPVIVYAGYQEHDCFYRARIMTVELWRLVTFSRLEDWPDSNSNGLDDTTLGGFIAMNREQQLRLLSETGIAKVEAFVSKNQL